MSLFNRNFIIPETNGAIFNINTENCEQLKKVTTALIRMPEVKKVVFNCDVYPHLMTVHSRKLLRVSHLLDKVSETGFQAFLRY